MKYLLSIIVIFLLPFQSFGSFHARNITRPGYDWYYFKMEQLNCDVEVMGLFYQTTITFKLSLTRTDFDAPYPGDYEIIWDFTLVEDAAVTDCWLKPANSTEFINADIVDLDTAEKNYDKYPYTQPRMLLRHRWDRQWNGDLNKRFQMSFTPVTLTQSPTIKIRYISPCLPYYDTRRILIPLNEFATYFTCWPVIRIRDFDNPAASPYAISETDYLLTWYKSGDYWQTTYNFDYSQLIIGCTPESPERAERSYLRTFTKDDVQFYQLSLLPPLSDQDIKQKNILLAVDLTAWNVDRNVVVEEFEKAVRLSTTEKDSITLLYTAFTPAIYDSNFITATPAHLGQIFTKLKSQPSPKLNTLPQLLRQGVNIFNIHKRSGEIWLLSNANTHCDPPETAMEIISQTMGIAEHPIKFKVINADFSYWPSQWINNQNYIGDDYLFENLARLSWGTFVKLREAAYSYNFLDAMLDGLAPTTTSVEIAADPAGGLSYSTFQLNRGRVNFPITLPYYEIGLFDGSTPFNVNYFGLIDGDLFAKSINIPQQAQDLGWDILATYWYDRYIQNLLREPQSFETIDFIQETSVSERLLTPYSGFVIPGPEGEAAFRRLTEQAVTAVLPREEKTVEIPRKFEIAAYPNPFNSSTMITMPLQPDENRTTIHITIFNYLGQIIRTETVTVDPSLEALRFQWDGLDNDRVAVTSGVYIVHVAFSDVSKNLKITLLR
jgi:hypothetical protein